MVLISADTQSCLTAVFEILDYENERVLSKDYFFRAFYLINNLFDYFGDKFLQKLQVQDLVDSIFTNSGRIEGCISYDDYLDVIKEHPIVELLLSPQFQGIFLSSR